MDGNGYPRKLVMPQPFYYTKCRKERKGYATGSSTLITETWCNIKSSTAFLFQKAIKRGSLLQDQPKLFLLGFASFNSLLTTVTVFIKNGTSI